MNGSLLRFRIAALLILTMFLTSASVAQRPAPQRPANTPAGVTKSSPAQKPKYKAIFEPVNYGEDVEFYSVAFVDDKNGWAAGGANAISGGLIIHTTDGGEHWTLQVGDPKSSDRRFENLRMLDATHGFAIQPTGQASNLFRTDDGEHWVPVGKVAEHLKDIEFTSPTSGIYVGRDVQFTADGGKTWKQTAKCATTVQVNGLSRNVQCELTWVHFPSPSTGYAVGYVPSTKDLSIIAKTGDGGVSWTISSAPTDGIPEDVYFLDDATGFMRTGGAEGGKLYRTTDGGATWNAIAISPGTHMQFAGKNVGWGFHYNKMGFSTDGGNRWSSRTIPFPAPVKSFSLPQPDHGWVVGDHGMVYRYRIVPAEYTAKGMLEAPAMAAAPSN